MPEPSPANIARLAAALRDLEAEGDLEPDDAGPAAGGNRVLLTRHGRLDVMQDVPGLRDFAQLRSGAVDVGGVLYAAYEELISMKVASGREEDLRDVGALEAARREH